jgi:hypothetical protein
MKRWRESFTPFDRSGSSSAPVAEDGGELNLRFVVLRRHKAPTPAREVRYGRPGTNEVTDVKFRASDSAVEGAMNQRFPRPDSEADDDILGRALGSILQHSDASDSEWPNDEDDDDFDDEGYPIYANPVSSSRVER